MQKFEELFNSPYLVFDGGVATELYERGFYINRPFEELNLSHPRDVIKMHEDYLEAGAMMVTTNSFSLTPSQLDKFDIRDRLPELLDAAIRNASEAVRNHKNQARVGLTFGPLSVLIEPLGPTSLEEVRGIYEDLVKKALRTPLFDFYILETFGNLDELECAVDGIRRVDQKRPILASVTVRSSETALIQQFANRLGSRADVQALGLNCSEGPSDLFQSLKILKPLTEKPIVIQPNAGIPRNINGRYFYMTSPDYLGKYAKRYIEAGAFGVGGCCGTGPDHIRSIAQSLKMMNAKGMSQGMHQDSQNGEPLDFEKVNPEKQGNHSRNHRQGSRILETLSRGKKVITLELTSPRGTDIEKFIENLRKIREAGIEFVNVPDGARASTRASSLHLASFVNSQYDRFGLTLIPHLTTRDRNLIALQSDLIGASINQVNDVLLITGDPPKLGNSRDATAVYDIDSIGLTYLANRLNQGLSLPGDPLGSNTQFGIGVATNPTAINLELEIQRWKYKVESGADFAITQPIYEVETFLKWKKEIQSSYRPHLIGIWPFVSFKNAEFMAHEVPGVHVPAWALEKMASVQQDPEASMKMGIEIAAKIMKEAWNHCEGFAISAPLGKVDVALEVLKHV